MSALGLEVFDRTVHAGTERTRNLDDAPREASVRPARTVEEDRLRDEVCSALWKTGRFFGGEIDVNVEGDRAILIGAVPTYFLKQLAQTAALNVRGVRDLSNEIEVI